VAQVARNLAILLWSDLARAIAEPAQGDTDEILCVKKELRRRID
jgi:hypothetical protein